MVQPLAIYYADPELHNAQRYRRTDGRTDGHTTFMMPIADHTVCRSTIG